MRATIPAFLLAAAFAAFSRSSLLAFAAAALLSAIA